MSSLEQQALARQWFYAYKLPGGQVVPTYVNDHILKIHETRRDMMNGILDSTFGDDLSGVTALDLSSHQGYFSLELAKRVKSVVGIERQPEHVADARLITEIMGVGNVEYREMNIFDSAMEAIEPVDAVVMFGLLYNLENPFGALRTARRLTRKVLLIETQTTMFDVTGPVDSGRYNWQNEMKGIFGIFPGLPGVKDGSEFNMMLYPSPGGLMWILSQLGFSRVERVPVPEDGYEQLMSGKRIMVAAYV